MSATCVLPCGSLPAVTGVWQAAREVCHKSFKLARALADLAGFSASPRDSACSAAFSRDRRGESSPFCLVNP